MWNNYRHLELYQAIPSMGCVLHTLNIRLSPHDLTYIINHAENRIIFVDEDLLPLVEPILSKTPTVELLVVCSEGENTKLEKKNQIDYEKFIQEHSDEFTWPNLDENARWVFATQAGLLESLRALCTRIDRLIFIPLPSQ